MFNFMSARNNAGHLINELTSAAFSLCDYLTFDNWKIIIFDENKMFGFILCSSYGDKLDGYAGFTEKIYLDKSEENSPLNDLLDGKKLIFSESSEPLAADLYLPLMTSIPNKIKIIGCLHMSKCDVFENDIDKVLSCDYAKSQIISMQRDFEIIYNGYIEDRKFFNLVHIFFNIASSKDPFIEGHSYNVALLSNLLGKELDFSYNHLNKLYIASLLHDIGKIYIPEQILNKNDKLTEEEMEVVKRHSLYGHDIINDLVLTLGNISDISDIILQHHERYDGTGYPNGLAGEEICLESRIIAIADSVDAMLSIRSYKEPKTLQGAIDDIIFNKGKQFDPNLVKPMIRILIKKQELQESILEKPIIAGTLEILTEAKSCQLQGTLIKTSFGYKLKPDCDECKCEKCKANIPDLISSTFHTESNGKLYEYSAAIKHKDMDRIYISKLSPKASYNYFSMPWSLKGAITIKNSSHFGITINKIGGDYLSFIAKSNLFDTIETLYDVNIVNIDFDDGKSVAITGKTIKAIKMGLNIYCEFKYINILESTRVMIFKQIFQRQTQLTRSLVGTI